MEANFNFFYLFKSVIIAVPTISTKLSRTWRTSLLRRVWPICHNCFLLTAEQHKVVGCHYIYYLTISDLVRIVLRIDFLGDYCSELPITGTILSASLLVGFTTTLILFCSHFHQVTFSSFTFISLQYFHICPFRVSLYQVTYMVYNSGKRR